jgi:hypothetical protein
MSMKQLKKTGVMLAFLLALALVGSSFASAAVEVEGDAYVGVYSKYLSKGFDYSDGKAVLQGGMDLSAYGFTFSVWSNAQLKSSDDIGSGINETDFYIDYTFSAGEIASVSVGTGHYTYSYANEENESENEAYVGVAFDVLFAPEFYVTYGWDVPGDDGMAGLFYKLSGSHEIELTEVAALTLGALLSYNQESYFAGDYSAFHNYEITAALDYALNDNWSLTGEVLFSDALSDDAEDAGIEDEFVGGLSVTFSF